MNNLYQKIKDEFIRASDGQFLFWSEIEQEEAIQRVMKSVYAAENKCN